MEGTLTIDIKHAETQKRLVDQIYKLEKYNSTPGNGVTRVLYSEEDLQAKSYVKELMRDVGLEVWEDHFGNIFGKLEGENPEWPPIWTGSHLDAPLNSGMFDGVVGVLGAIEAVRLIKMNGFKTKRDLVVVIFAAEEPTRFGVGCLGSRALTGALSEEDLLRFKDKENISLYQAMKDVGYQPKRLNEVPMKDGDLGAFIELHIEQGAVLETEELSIGIVDVIAAPTEIELILHGEQRHAGSTPMNIRKDPMMAAAEISLELERWAKNTTSSYTVATVGRLEVEPGTSNVIPGKINMSIDSRDVNLENKKKFVSFINEMVKSVCEKRGIDFELNLRTNDEPSIADEKLVNTIKQACEDRNISYKVMASGAYHDAMMMSKKAPFSMIFVPSRDGISHDKREWTDFDEIVKGVEVLTQALLQLTSER